MVGKVSLPEYQNSYNDSTMCFSLTSNYHPPWDTRYIHIYIYIHIYEKIGFQTEILYKVGINFKDKPSGRRDNRIENVLGKLWWRIHSSCINNSKVKSIFTTIIFSSLLVDFEYKVWPSQNCDCVFCTNSMCKLLKIDLLYYIHFLWTQ